MMGLKRRVNGVNKRRHGRAPTACDELMVLLAIVLGMAAYFLWILRF